MLCRYRLFVEAWKKPSPKLPACHRAGPPCARPCAAMDRVTPATIDIACFSATTQFFRSFALLPAHARNAQISSRKSPRSPTADQRRARAIQESSALVIMGRSLPGLKRHLWPHLCLTGCRNFRHNAGTVFTLWSDLTDRREQRRNPERSGSATPRAAAVPSLRARFSAHPTAGPVAQRTM